MEIDREGIFITNKKIIFVVIKLFYKKSQKYQVKYILLIHNIKKYKTLKAK